MEKLPKDPTQTNIEQDDNKAPNLSKKDLAAPFALVLSLYALKFTGVLEFHPSMNRGHPEIELGPTGQVIAEKVQHTLHPVAEKGNAMADAAVDSASNAVHWVGNAAGIYETAPNNEGETTKYIIDTTGQLERARDVMNGISEFTKAVSANATNQETDTAEVDMEAFLAGKGMEDVYPGANSSSDVEPAQDKE